MLAVRQSATWLARTRCINTSMCKATLALISPKYTYCTSHKRLSQTSSQENTHAHTKTVNTTNSKTRTPGKVRITISTAAAGSKAVTGAEDVKQIEAPIGITLMEAIRDIAKMDIEAACDGTCACSTCHVIFTPASFAKLKSKPSDDEMDMLDLAPSVTDTSRLSCQVQLTSDLDDIEVRIPDEMENQLREGKLVSKRK